MRPIKRYVASVKAFFTPFILVKLSQFYSFTSPVLLPKNKRLWNERKEDFLHLWLFQSIVLYQRSKKNSCLAHNWILDIDVCITNPN